MINYSLSENPPLIWLKDNSAISLNGDYILAYRVQLPEKYSLGEKEYGQLLKLLHTAIKGLPSGSILLKQDPFLVKKYTPKREFNDFLSQSFYDHFNGRKYVEHNSYWFFILPKPSQLLNSDFIKSPFKKISPETAVNQPTHEMEKFRNVVKDTVTFLNASQFLTVYSFTEKSLLSYSRKYFNAFAEDYFTDSLLLNGGLTIDGKHIGQLSINNSQQLTDSINPLATEEAFSSKDYDFYRLYLENTGFNLSFDHVVNQVFFIQDKQKVLNELKKKKSIFEGSKGFSPGNKIHFQKLDRYLEDLYNKSDVNFVRFHYNVTVFGNSSEELEDNIRSLSVQFRTADIVPYKPKSKNLFSGYYNSFFGNVSNLRKSDVFLCELDYALPFIIPTTNYIQDEEGILLNDRINNIPTRRDFWDKNKKRIKARNIIITAPTGEGKSVKANTIFYQFLNLGIKLFINDLGDSYYKFCALFPDVSAYIKFQIGKPLGLNPFFINDKLEVEQLDQIVQLLKTLWKRDNPIETFELTSLRMIISYYYEVVSQDYSLSNFYKFVEMLYNKNLLESEVKISPDHFNAKEFLHILREFIGKGSYAYLFKESDLFNLDYDKLKLVVFEYGEAKNDPLIISILLILAQTPERKLVWANRSVPGYVFHDEFAKQLTFPGVLSNVEYKFQAIRKQYAGVGIVLQTPNQLPVNSTAASIVDNTQIFIVLYNGGGYEEIVKRYKLSSHDKNLLMSLRNNFAIAPKYSEAFIKIGSYSNVMRNELSQKMLAAFDTEGETHDKMMKHFAESNSMEETINYLIQ